MPRRVSDNFKSGMIPDILGAEGSLSLLRGGFIGRSGEIRSRGPIYAASGLRTPASGSFGGWGAGSFHPNFGIGICIGNATSTSDPGHLNRAGSYSILGSSFDDMDFYAVTEGVSRTEVPLHSGAVSSVTAVTGLPVEKLVRAVNTSNEIVFAAEAGSLFKYGGSLAAAYKTGTVSIASSFAASVATGVGAGGRIITGSGTTWAGNVQAGQYIMVASAARKANGTERAYRITRVIDNTHLEIELPIYTTGTATNLAYRIQSTALVQSPDGVWNRTTERPTSMGAIAYHQGRLFVGGTSDGDTSYNSVFNYDRIRWSGSVDENGTFTYPDATAASAGIATGTKTDTRGHGFSHLDLWHPNAFIDVFPGVGGRIQGLVSMGNELVIIKSHALFRLQGAMDYQGNGSGLDLQIINREVGAVGQRSWALTSRGLLIAAEDGLYLYDGEQVRSLTDDRMKNYWYDMLESYNGADCTVVQFEDKVIITPTTTEDARDSLVWDTERDLFWVIDNDQLPAPYEGIKVYGADDEFFGDIVFPIGETTQYYWTKGMMGWGAGSYFWFDYTPLYRYTSNITDLVAPGGEFPIQFVVLTQPVALGEDQLSEGRVIDMYAHMFIARGNEYFPVQPTQDIEGQISYGVNLLLPTQIATVEGFPDQGDYDDNIDDPVDYGLERIFRFNVPESSVAPYARFGIACSNVHAYNSIEIPSIAIYSIGVEYQQSNTRRT